MANKEFKYLLPRPENVLRLVNENIVTNLRRGHGAKLNLPPLVELAHMVVNETGVIPYKDYEQDVTFVDERVR
jgi:hypothetical protein